jgi:aspartyl-tRNA(Asn)/glutamyl-tRNA(Gln) amidotransferase subunit B
MSTAPYTLICGLEIHAELKTQSKMFCGCKNDPFHAEQPNIHTCPVCLGMPGALPVANRVAIEWVIKLGLALNCEINLFSKFDRKHYYYPDLPKGYQISQFDIPFCENGFLDTPEGRVRIRRIHLEEDTAKLQHTTVDGKKVSLIDFNRSSVPLVEIVSEPDLQTPSQAKLYAKKIRQLLRYLDIADCDMEQGGMRLEANISMLAGRERPAAGGALPPYKVEVKNINSFRFLEQAIAFEMPRQVALLEKGKTPTQETRGYNSTKGETFSQRSKEEAEDYRYFPDPDLPPIRLSTEWLKKLQATIPELPEAVQQRWQTTYQLEPRLVNPFTESQDSVSWADTVFVAGTKQQVDANTIAKALINKKISWSFDSSAAEILAAVLALTTTDTVDTAELDQAISEVLLENQDAATKYKSGDTKVLGFFMGQVMRKLGKKVAPENVQKALQTKLSE